MCFDFSTRHGPEAKTPTRERRGPGLIFSDGVCGDVVVSTIFYVICIGMLSRMGTCMHGKGKGADRSNNYEEDARGGDKPYGGGVSSRDGRI